MITISLNQIAAHNPCSLGWAKILYERCKINTSDFTTRKKRLILPLSLGDDVQFPLADALYSNGLDDVLWALRCLPEHSNLWRKFAVWCARRAQHLALDQRLADVLDVAWRHSDGLATDAELEDALAWASALARTAAQDAARDAAGALAAARALAAERETQTTKLRQILSAGHWVEDEE